MNKQVTDPFLAAYEQLNTAQRQAVDQIEGPVIVIAGPGTGKTQVLTLRIANILRQTDTKPENILALTFTDSGARAMRERLQQYVGAVAYQLPIHTFHGFADTLIRSYPEAYRTVVGGRPITELEQLRTLEEILSSGTYSVLRPVGNPTFHIRSIRQTIGTLKQEYISPDRLATLIEVEQAALAKEPRYHEKGAHKGKERGAYRTLAAQIEKLQELNTIYRAYQAYLNEQRLYDFADMITESVVALTENETMRLAVQETYQYILADEHQDVNESQNQIIDLLTSYHQLPNIFVVGDEKQAIYRFQGASLSNFLYFEDRYPGTTTISLTDNFRSGQNILDVAQSLITVPDETVMQLRVPLSSQLVTAGTVRLREFEHEASEQQWLIGAVKERLESGGTPSEIAVLVRTNLEVQQISQQLRAAGVAVTSVADSDIYQHPITRAMMSLLFACAHPSDHRALAEVLHGAYWSISTGDLIRVLSGRRYDRPLATIISDTTTLEALGVQDIASVHKVSSVLAETRTTTETMTPQHVLAKLLTASGFLQHIHQHDPWEGGRVVRRIYDEVELLVTSGEVKTWYDLPQVFATYQAYNIPLQAPFINVQSEAVQVMTAHRAKGLEYEEVFIPNLTDSRWGGTLRASPFRIAYTATSSPDDTLDDDRRLLYVAMTRAKHAVHLSYARQSSEGRERLVSRLLAPLLADESITTEDVGAFEATVVPTQTLAVPTADTLIDIDIITSLLYERGISPTSYNNYRSSPWNYLYRNLLRMPEPSTLSMQFGTVIHSVLERLVRTETPSTVTDTQLLEWLRHALERLPLSAEELTQLHEKGTQALTGYRETIVTQISNTSRSQTEVSLRASLSLPVPALPEVFITGTLDRIDYAPDGQVLRVVDYKTGKPKTRNAIMGKTTTNNGDYLVQLQFYALLLELTEQRHENIDYVLSFVEPDSRGRYREEVFQITDGELSDLKAGVATMVSQITTGACWQTPCDPNECEYCDWLPKKNVG